MRDNYSYLYVLLLVLIAFLLTFPKLSDQLQVTKSFPFWQVKAKTSLDCSKALDCLTRQVYLKVKCTQCDFSIIFDHSISHPSSSLFSSMSSAAFASLNPRTVSTGIHSNLTVSLVFKVRYSRFCRIVIGQDTKISTLNDSHNLFSESDVFNSFYILFTTTSQPSLSQTSRIIQKLLYVVFLSAADNETPNVECPNFTNVKPNWHFHPLIAMSDPTAPKSIVQHEQTGKWFNYYVAAQYHVALVLNATLNISVVLDPPRSKSLENGTWDSFVKPLVFQTAHLCTIRVPATDNQRFIYYTTHSYFDHYTFMTAVPRDLGTNAFFASYDDLLLIFGAVCLTTCGVLIILLLETLVIQPHDDLNHEGSSSLINKAFTTALGVFLKIVKPIFDQPFMNQSQERLNKLKPHSIVFAIWLLTVMALSSMYKSNFVSDIVNPNFEYMPRTFEQLVESDFKFKAIFFKGNSELLFQSIKNPVHDAVLGRTEDCLFFDPKVSRDSNIP